MKVTINNLLTESLIDEIPSFTKMDKAILKFLHQNTPIPSNEDYWVNVDSYKVWDLMKTFGLTDGDYIFKMWKIYKKYNDILFNDLTDIGKYDPSDYDVAADVIIMNYYINNIVGKMIYPGWRVELLESMEVMISEDMITMEIRHVTYPPTIFVDLNLSDMKRRHRVSIELMSMDEEGWGQELHNNERALSTDTIALERRMIDPPKNLSDKELQKYFDEIFDEAHEFIEKYDEEMVTYYKENRPDLG